MCGAFSLGGLRWSADRVPALHTDRSIPHGKVSVTHRKTVHCTVPLQVKSAKPGILSEDLRVALGMGENTPPPWLINMQRYGPPPSYPDLKIPGLNAPIPPGARFGYQAGGWGKPPVDEEGNPLYGDGFGLYEEESDDEQVRSLGSLVSNAE